MHCFFCFFKVLWSFQEIPERQHKNVVLDFINSVPLGYHSTCNSLTKFPPPQFCTAPSNANVSSTPYSHHSPHHTIIPTINTLHFNALGIWPATSPGALLIKKCLSLYKTFTFSNAVWRWEPHWEKLPVARTSHLPLRAHNVARRYLL